MPELKDLSNSDGPSHFKVFENRDGRKVGIDLNEVRCFYPDEDEQGKLTTVFMNHHDIDVISLAITSDDLKAMFNKAVLEFECHEQEEGCSLVYVPADNIGPMIETEDNTMLYLKKRITSDTYFYVLDSPDQILQKLANC